MDLVQFEFERTRHAHFVHDTLRCCGAFGEDLVGWSDHKCTHRAARSAQFHWPLGTVFTLHLRGTEYNNYQQ